ncbi:glycosyltransferase family 2 protein [Anaerobacillus alkaliphilus]|uniref:Glucosyl-3-phosphoglycerate synthase n=1 Tax=Anaerobacillus alkaliphilus TaxID=1548597 RepID=A0A4Q0VSJ1_9BACI|nr:glycosyltransferase family 2 protein [Anaerobacillus alkaliphilus]RXI99531.1 glycosyltransferase family 2 protein [Anaerobacillus alkaliphilus]
MKKPLISVVIPAFNEEDLIKMTLVTLNRCSWVNELIVVDDGSRDDTATIAEKYCDEVIKFKENKGKATALKEGWKRTKGDIIVSLDADLGITAREGERLVEKLEVDNLDCVIAKLPLQKKRGIGLMKHRAQKLIFSRTGKWFEAPLSGQRALKKNWLPTLLEKDYIGFGVEMAMTVDLLKAGAVVDEVEVSFFHRATGKDLDGFLHRGKQWLDMERTLRKMRASWQ